MSAAGPFIKHPRGRWQSEVLGSWRRQWRNELRVNRMLLSESPPVATPRLLDFHRGTHSFVFERIDGQPLGPKFPFELDPDDAIELTLRLGRYRPRRRWHRRLPLERRMHLHLRDGLVTASDADILVSTLTAHPWHFAHGDITARNLMRDDDRLFLIDWEWAGLHPSGHDLAFLWFTLIDAPDARSRVEEAVTDRRTFLANAAAVTLLHLQMWRERPPRYSQFVGNHTRSLHATLDELRG